jgi:hypothetical protein
VIIEFNYNVPDNNTIPAYIQLSSVKRQVLDIDFVRITYDTVAKVIITPSDPEYLCRTNAVLTPLVPATMDSEEVKAWQQTVAFGWSKIRNGYSGTALYDFGSGLLAWYMRTGDPWVVREAAAWATWNIAYYIPYVNDTCCSESQRTVLNPENLPGQGLCGACGLSAEWWSLKYIMNHAYYHFFGYEQYCYYSWHQSQGYMAGANPRPTATTCMSNNYLFRFNFGLFFFPTVAAYLTEGVTKISGGFGAGPGDPDFPSKIPLIIDCIEYNKFNDSSDYRYGIGGQMPTSIDLGPTNPGMFPTFQVSVAADFLIMYYQSIRADPRIPPMVRAMGDYVIAETVPSIAGEPGYPTSWVMPYITTRGTRPADARPWTGYLFPMFTNTFGFLYAYYKNDTYKEWGDRTLLPEEMSGMIWLTKVWGEIFMGFRHSYSYYMNGGAAEGRLETRPGSTIPPVTNTTDPVGNTKVTVFEPPPVAQPINAPSVSPTAKVSFGQSLVVGSVLHACMLCVVLL